MSDNPVRPAYVIRTVYWGRYYDIYGEDWVDMESTVYRDCLGEAIKYAKDQCIDPKTIQATVLSTFNYEVMYRGEPNGQHNNNNSGE